MELRGIGRVALLMAAAVWRVRIMARAMLLFLFVFAASHAQSIEEFKKYHYPKLLNMWRESGEYQETGSAEYARCVMNHREVDDIIRKTMKTHYNIDIGGALIGGISVGKQLEYRVERVNMSSTKERFWFLVSKPLKKVVSTYKEPFEPDADTPWYEPENQQTRERQNARSRDAQNHFLYEDLFDIFKYMETGIPFRYRCEPSVLTLCQPWWGLSRYLNDGMDSATAVCMAVSAAERCYGPKMTVLAATLMGDDEEYWVVYCFPAAWLEKGNEKYWCYDTVNHYYNVGKLLFRRPFAEDESSKCPNVIGVLISRETGQVLSTIEL